jgi:hypothetical protein
MSLRHIRNLCFMTLATFLGPAAFLAQGALTPAGALPHFTTGGGWRTVWILVNSSNNPNAAVQLNFIGSDGPAGTPGTPLTIPLADGISGQALPASSTYSVTIRPFGLVALESTSSDPTATEGWVQVSTDSSTTTVLERFDYTSLPSNGIVNLQRGGTFPQFSATATGYMLPFVEAQGDFTAIAIANVTNTTLNVAVTIRNYLGTTKGTHTLTLAPQEHASFLLSTKYPETAGVAGTIEFYAGGTNQIAVMGLSFNGINDAFTSELSIPTTGVQ